MDLTGLRYFQAIARAGSMTAAARALRVSQPALTVSIQKLEAGLGSKLFLRDRSGVRLTSTGRELLHYAGEVFALIERAEQQIHGLEADDIGSFVLGCSEALGSYFLPTLLRRFGEQAPRIQISLWNGPSPAVQQAVLAREVHFGLVVRALPHPDLVLVELFRDATDLFVAADQATRSERMARERLRAGPLIYVPGLPSTEALLYALRTARLLPERRLTCGHLPLVKSLALGGVGVAMLPRRVAATDGTRGLRRLHAELPYAPDTIYLCYRGDLHRTRSAMRLKEALVAHGRTLAGRQGASSP